jgi:deoxyribodipyrimidine photolyase-related protein
MRAILILGNQLFSTALLKERMPEISLVFMREDAELCTHFKYHKQKIHFFLSAMRKHRADLESSGFDVCYQELSDTSESYDVALKRFIGSKKITELHCFEIEDKFFESRIVALCDKLKVKLVLETSPMFVTTRDDFKKYLGTVKRPFMKSFYEKQRKRLKILVEKDGSPSGGKWSFDEDNRKPLPKNYVAYPMPALSVDPIDRKVTKLIEKRFSDHPGDLTNCWLPTSRTAALGWLDQFLEERFFEFGPYEDALSTRFPFVNHSVLTPFLNTGLLCPDEVIARALKVGKKMKVPMNSQEGFVRQVIGWREFVRGIYQNFSEKQDTSNFWKHERKLTEHWYNAKTGIPPLDDVIQKTLKFGYAHHIERLMIVGSLMLLLEIHPHEAHRWFMEMYVDSSDWVMGPNVYGMALFSDGGIFATKPYICGSNYYRKMGGYKEGDWSVEVDGLYWSFVDKHRVFMGRNPRLSMMVKTFDKMDSSKKQQLLLAAQRVKDRISA